MFLFDLSQQGKEKGRKKGKHRGVGEGRREGEREEGRKEERNQGKEERKKGRKKNGIEAQSEWGDTEKKTERDSFLTISLMYVYKTDSGSKHESPSVFVLLLNGILD